MNKLRVTALLLAVILAVGGIVLKICGYDAQTDFEPTLPLDTVLNSEQAQKDLKYVYDTVRAKHPLFLIDDGAEKRFGDVYIKLRRELRDKDSVTVNELWEKSAELVCTLDDAHTIVTASGTEYVNGGNEISKAYNDGTLVPTAVLKHNAKHIVRIKADLRLAREHLFEMLLHTVRRYAVN